MNIGNRAIDHIVYCVPDLNQAIEFFEKNHGVKAIIGGRHLSKGTKNALIHLGQQCYLEILAIDNDNQDFVKNRWMGIDHITKPKITRWSLKSNDLTMDQVILRNYNNQMGQIEIGERATPSGNMLQWNMILPLNIPEIDLIPFMTDWSTSEKHPCDFLDEFCRLLKIGFEHPNPKLIQKHFKALDFDMTVGFSNEVKIRIEIEGPNGVFSI